MAWEVEMSSFVLLLVKVLGLVCLVLAALLIWRRRDQWGRLLLLAFIAIAHGRHLVATAIGRRA